MEFGAWGESLMTFAHDLSAAIRKSSKLAKKGSPEESIVFLKRAGILTATGKLKGQFKTVGQKTVKSGSKKRG